MAAELGDGVTMPVDIDTVAETLKAAYVEPLKGQILGESTLLQELNKLVHQYNSNPTKVKFWEHKSVGQLWAEKKAELRTDVWDWEEVPEPHWSILPNVLTGVW